MFNFYPGLPHISPGSQEEAQCQLSCHWILVMSVQECWMWSPIRKKFIHITLYNLKHVYHSFPKIRPPFLHTSLRRNWGGGHLPICLVDMPPYSVPRNLEYMCSRHNDCCSFLENSTLLNVYYEKLTAVVLILSREASKQLASSVVTEDNPV